jgi:hypothetical protein
MTDLGGFKSRVLQLLGDTGGTRFADECLEEAMRQALTAYSLAQPQVLETEITLAVEGREQVLEVTPAPLFVIKLMREEKEVPFQFYVRSGQPVVVIGGDSLPSAGDVYRLRYAAAHSVEDLDAETVTSLAAGHESILVRGAAGFSALMRLAGVSEAYGKRPAEGAHLAEIGRQFLDDFRRMLGDLQRAERMHEYPAGFTLDGEALCPR